MMRSIRTAGIVAATLAGLGGLASAQTPAKPPSAAEAQVLAICRDEGGAPQTCACGLDLARQTLTPREIALFPVLWPVVNGPGDPFAKVTKGLDAAQSRGFTPQEALTLVSKVQAHSARVQRQCPQPSAG